MIPENHQKLLRFNVLVESRLHESIDWELWRVSHVIEHHLTKYIVLRILVPFIKNLVIYMLNSIYGLRNLGLAYVQEFLCPIRGIRVKTVLLAEVRLKPVLGRPII